MIAQQTNPAYKEFVKTPATVDTTPIVALKTTNQFVPANKDTLETQKSNAPKSGVDQIPIAPVNMLASTDNAHLLVLPIKPSAGKTLNVTELTIELFANVHQD